MPPLAHAKLLLRPWVLVTVGIVFNIVSALITSQLIDINNRSIQALEAKKTTLDVSINSLWQNRQDVERKREFILLLLQLRQSSNADAEKQVGDDKMIREGDSILIKIPTNVLFSESFRQPVPPTLNPEGEITFCIGAASIKTQGQMQAEALEQSKEQMDVDIEIIESYLAENNIMAQSTESGLRYVIENEGAGENPQQGDKVFVHYTGALLDGTKFDSSFDRDGPLDFNIGQGEVIMGWDEGIALLKPGGKGTLYVPSPMAYGPRGAGGAIGPNSVLKFDVELIKIE